MKRWAAVVLALVAGTGIAVGQARLGPYVVDSNGLKVGHADSGNQILLFIEGVPTVVSAGTGGFTPATYDLWYTDGSCGGQALLNVQASNQLFGLGYYTTDGVIRYFSAASIVSTTVLSALTVQTDGTFGSCGPSPNSLFVAPALTGSALGFTPPFSVVDTLPVSPAPSTATFNDVPTTHPFFQFIEALYNSGITGGCSAAPPLYCPDNPVTRGQMAVFLAKALGL
jgi:hypothetical protein